MKKRILLLTPPLLQTNTPYPATMHLAGFLKSRGFKVFQRDLSIKVARDVLLKYGDETTDELLEFLSGPAPIAARRARRLTSLRSGFATTLIPTSASRATPSTSAAR